MAQDPTPQDRTAPQSETRIGVTVGLYGLMFGLLFAGFMFALTSFLANPTHLEALKLITSAPMTLGAAVVFVCRVVQAMQLTGRP